MRIQFYGGPGAGKSTAAAITLAYLKEHHVQAELVTERCKPAAYSKRMQTQRFITQGQIAEEDRWAGLFDKVTLVYESPALLGAAFQPALLDQLLNRERVLPPSLNIFMLRDSVYDTSGRIESQDEAIMLDRKIRDVLTCANKTYKEVSYGDWTTLKGIIRAHY